MEGVYINTHFNNYIQHEFELLPDFVTQKTSIL